MTLRLGLLLLLQQDIHQRLYVGEVEHAVVVVVGIGPTVGLDGLHQFGDIAQRDLAVTRHIALCVAIVLLPRSSCAHTIFVELMAQSRDGRGSYGIRTLRTVICFCASRRGTSSRNSCGINNYVVSWLRII